MNVRFRPKADIANVNVLSKPPHLGASCAYLENVTAAEFCEKGGHRLEVGETETLADFDEVGLLEHGVLVNIELDQNGQRGSG